MISGTRVIFTSFKLWVGVRISGLYQQQQTAFEGGLLVASAICFRNKAGTASSSTAKGHIMGPLSSSPVVCLGSTWSVGLWATLLGDSLVRNQGHAVDLNKKSPVVCKQEKVHAFMGVNMSAL